jgi:hypothetical protein
MWRFVAHFLLASLVLEPFGWLVVAQGGEHSDLLSQMALRHHYEGVLRGHEQDRFALEEKLETLKRRSTFGRSGNVNRKRSREIQLKLRDLDQRIQSGENRLYKVRKDIDHLRQTEYGQKASLKDEELSVAIGAGNALNILNATNHASKIPAHLRQKNPTTGVLARTKTKITTIEKWKNGKYYKVSRYADGPSKGKFAKGGRQELTAKEVKKMGSQLKTQQVSELRSSLSQSQTRIDSLRQEIRKTADPAAKTKLQGKLDRSQKIQSELKADLQKSQARPVTSFIKSGASFAAMAVAITGGYRLVKQAIAADGDLSDLDYKAAFNFVGTEEFWAGTAGSFTGGMLGAAITSFLPGPFKVLGAIAGASVGHQAAMGALGTTDWTQIAVQSIGSTMGFLLGAFIGAFMGPFAPIAIIAFSILGSWAADMALEWIRKSLTPGISAFNLKENRDPTLVEVQAYADQFLSDDLSKYDVLTEAALREELWITYSNYRTLQELEPEFQSPQERETWEQETKVEWTRYQYLKSLLDNRKAAYFGNQTVVSR